MFRLSLLSTGQWTSLYALFVLINLNIPQQVNADVLLLKQSRAQVVLECIELTDSQFELSFIHSVSLTQVFDSYKLLPKKSVVGSRGENKNEIGSLLYGNGALEILQTQERFSAHGQGLPSLVDEPNALSFEHKDGKFILHLERPINNLIVRTDKRFKNRLYTADRVVDLNQWPDTGISIIPLKQCPN